MKEVKLVIDRLKQDYLLKIGKAKDILGDCFSLQEKNIQSILHKDLDDFILRVQSMKSQEKIQSGHIKAMIAVQAAAGVPNKPIPLSDPWAGHLDAKADQDVVSCHDVIRQFVNDRSLDDHFRAVLVEFIKALSKAGKIK